MGTTVYFDHDLIDEEVAVGRHRELVGGLWQEIGRLQFEFVRNNGLQPSHTLLDLGCGCLRGGVHFIRYLDAGNYFGIDANQSLLDSGFDIELSNAGLTKRLPRANLRCDSDFNAAGFGRQFEVVVAISLFTHLPVNYLRVCLERLAPAVVPAGRFFATFFFAPECRSFGEAFEQVAGITTTALADPYHYRLDDIFQAAQGLPWTVRVVGNWNHPRNQQMVIFERQPDVAMLAPGDHHYRAYVGPADRYDFMGASQFSLLFQLGLREHHKVLDFGCGSLRLGRLLIPWLQPDRYFGIDPNAWLIEAGFRHELGTEVRTIKRPRFNHNSDFDCAVFGTRFDVVVAQSILTHCGPELCRRFFGQMARVLDEDGVAVFSYQRTQAVSDSSPDGWHYPECVTYTEAAIMAMANAAGLAGTALPWFHPGATWFAVTLKRDRLPNTEAMRRMDGLSEIVQTNMAPDFRRRPNPRVRVADESEAGEIAARIGTGHARLLEPVGAIKAGDVVRLVFEYTAGRSTVATGGKIRFCFHHVCTWSPAQTVNPAEPGYVEAYSPSGAQLTVTAWGDPTPPVAAMLSHFPWQHAIEVVVGSPGLYEGERVIVTYGAGQAQSMAQSFAADPYHFRALLDPQGLGFYLPAEQHPLVTVIGGAATRLVIVTPSDHYADAPGWVLVRVEDAAGNLAEGFEGPVTVEGDGLVVPLAHYFSKGERLAHRFENVGFRPVSLCRLIVRAERGLIAQSNPFRIWPSSVVSPAPTLWGDIHGHSARSDGYGTPAEYFAYARDVSGLDFAALTDHDFMLSDVAWTEIKHACSQANVAGHFITLQSYEWSGMTDVGGDRNVYFRGDDPPICRSRTLYDYRNPFVYHGADKGANHVEDLYRWLDINIGEGDVVTIPQWGGRPANPRWLDPRYDRLVEIFSEHQRSEDWAAGFRGQGGRIGVVAGGDDHIGRPGNGFLAWAPGSPDFVGPKALLAVKAGRDRIQVFESLLNRRTYATTGARILVDFEMDGHSMGDSFVACAAPLVRALVMGTAHLRQVEVLCDGVVVYAEVPTTDPSALQFEWLDKDFLTRDAECAYWLRVVQDDDHLAVTSPIWVTQDSSKG